MKLVIIGGTGLIGSKLVTRLREHGHEAVPASPDTGVNTLTGEGLAEALQGASVVVDVSNSPSFEDAAVMEFFTTSTRNLLTYAAAAGVAHYVALSVVGTERIPDSPYLRAKNTQEALIKDGGIPYSIVHATQFFEFVKRIADEATVGTTVRLPPVLIQPMAADDVATTVGRVAVGAPVNGTIEVGGPQQFRFDDLIRQGLSARKDPREVVVDPHARVLWGRARRAFSDSCRRRATGRDALPGVAQPARAPAAITFLMPGPSLAAGGGGALLFHREQVNKHRGIAVFSSGTERGQQTALRDPERGCPRPLGHMLAGTGDELPRVGFLQSKDLRDVAVRVVEGLSKNVGGPFRGRQPLEQDAHRARQRIGAFGTYRLVGAGVDWFRQPGPDGCFAARVCGLYDVDRNSCRRRREEGGGVTDAVTIRHLPADPHVLHNVFGRRRATQHAVGNAEESRAHSEEG